MNVLLSRLYNPKFRIVTRTSNTFLERKSRTRTKAGRTQDGPGRAPARFFFFFLKFECECFITENLPELRTQILLISFHEPWLRFLKQNLFWIFQEKKDPKFELFFQLVRIVCSIWKYKTDLTNEQIIPASSEINLRHN